MEEKKNNKGLIWLIIILIILVLGLVGYIVYDKVLKTDNDIISNNITTTNKSQNEEKNNEENILRRDTFIYELNGEDYNITFLYEKADENEVNTINSGFEDLEEAKNNGDYVYNVVYVKILINEKEIDKKIVIHYDFNNNLDNLPLLTRDNINKIKGIDKEYFVFEIQHRNSDNIFMDGGINPLIISENGKIIHELEFDDATGWWTTDKNSIMYEKGNYNLTNDTLYYLVPNCEKTNDNNLYFDQYSLNVENNKVIIEKQGTYKGDVAGGAVCGG